MYIKTLEISGFKSFANKTCLQFEPVMTAIVGPNGCGKSNVSDAIRWALGEQSPKALRAAKMEDCIFNGTDTRKPLGMAEVSITFAECENTLSTEYNEITVTRRVFRTGEGQYFINKTPCRLKDIQRLFMDTGIGTTSYSLMEQGRIDQILSARPEDRRTIFEEVSGITKYKVDKKEAIRKLEYTEANLLRLADVIREVKRQIGSLQRQAGKARRYKVLKDELKKLDIVATKKRLILANNEIDEIESKITTLSNSLHSMQTETQDLTRKSSSSRSQLSAYENEIASAVEAQLHAQNEFDHANELIRVNRQRIQEYNEWASRDSREIDDNKKLLEKERQHFQELSQKMSAARSNQKNAENELATATNNLSQHKQRIDNLKARIQSLREESVETESLLAHLQNQIIEVDSRERSTVIQRERLSAEKTQLARVAADYNKKLSEMTETLKSLAEQMRSCETNLKKIEDERDENINKKESLRQKLSELNSQMAARNAQIDLLTEHEASKESFPRGAKLLLDKTNPLQINPEHILGAFSDNIKIDQKYRIALEASLRAWLDAILVTSSSAAVDILHKLQSHSNTTARLLAIDMQSPAKAASKQHHQNKTRLMDFVQCPDKIAPLLEHLIGNIMVIESIDSIPSPIPNDLNYVTVNGCFAGGDGRFELWSTDAREQNPLSLKHMLSDAHSDRDVILSQIKEEKPNLDDLSARITAQESSISQAKLSLDQSLRSLAQKEGENQIISDEATEARERLETVSWELDNILANDKSGDSDRNTISTKMTQLREQRETIADTIIQANKELETLENSHSEMQSKLTDMRVQCSSLAHNVEYMASQYEFSQKRIAELDAVVEGRSEGINSYNTSINKLTQAIEIAESQLSTLQNKVTVNSSKAEQLKEKRAILSKQLEQIENDLTQKRSELEQLFSQKSELDVHCAESKIRRQNLVDRVTSEYSLSMEQIMNESDPEWEGTPPDIEILETRIAEIQTKIEAMGPVNLIAIEEYQELEERHTFLTGQETDLIKAKEQLMDMIKKINRTTSEMFRSTFEQVNNNFQTMFRKLFNGGSAKLVLVNEEDVLECGIEIIARPPGKRLQNVSLLSGGERTLSAVALLFAIYLIKPSPFCLLDEIDAALDETNIGRFVKILEEFLKSSQFIVITHSKQTISAAKVLYGVTMPEKGVSEIVSMKFKDAERVVS